MRSALQSHMSSIGSEENVNAIEKPGDTLANEKGKDIWKDLEERDHPVSRALSWLSAVEARGL
jgi:hypothetical protein